MNKEIHVNTTTQPEPDTNEYSLNLSANCIFFFVRIIFVRARVFVSVTLVFFLCVSVCVCVLNVKTTSQNCCQRRRHTTKTQSNERAQSVGAVLFVLLSTMPWSYCIQTGIFTARMLIWIESGRSQPDQIFDDVTWSSRLAIQWTWKRMLWSILHTIFKG